MLLFNQYVMKPFEASFEAFQIIFHILSSLFDQPSKIVARILLFFTILKLGN